MLDLEKIIDWIKNKVDSHTTSIDGLNTSVDSINSKLTDSGWITLNSIIKYRKINGVVYINILNPGLISVPINAWKLLGTLPTGYRPSVEISYTYDYYGDPLADNTTATITTAGEVKFYPGGTATSYLRGSTSFPVD